MFLLLKPETTVVYDVNLQLCLVNYVFRRVVASWVVVFFFLQKCSGTPLLEVQIYLYYKRAKELKIISHLDVFYPPKLVSLRSQIQYI
jgi:hypothetical protein